MANLENLQTAPRFGPDNIPLNNGRKPGVRNRATILATYLQCKVDRNHPLTGEQVNVTVEEAIHLELIKLAIQCKRPETQLNAIKEIFDTMYGKHTERVELDASLVIMTAEERREALSGAFFAQQRQLAGKCSGDSELNAVDCVEGEFEDGSPVE